MRQPASEPKLNLKQERELELELESVSEPQPEGKDMHDKGHDSKSGRGIKT